MYNQIFLGSGGGVGIYSKTQNNTVTNDVTNTGLGIIGGYFENDQNTDGESVRMLAVKTVSQHQMLNSMDCGWI